MPLPAHVPPPAQLPPPAAPASRTASAAPPGFADLGLPQDLASAVADLGFTTPTEIQAAAIPPLLAGRDLTGIAQTGTGKTAAFAIPLLHAVNPADSRVQALVLTPTRELAGQVAAAIEELAGTRRAVRVLPIYGGASFGPQLRGLAEGAHVVVGTPGRVIDMLTRGRLDLSAVRFLVLDEADEMLRMGFAEDVDHILGHAPADRQVALFSATMPPAIRSVARAHLQEPVEIAVSRPASTVAAVEQTYAVVPFRHKVDSLARVLAMADADAAIVFVRTRSAAEDVAAGLLARGVPAASISGDVPQVERERIVGRLRGGGLDVLVATDVAARGLDVERVGLVVNFDAPTEPEAYVHRIGRTGRAGRSGRAITFLTPHERGRLRAIESLTRAPLTEVTIPSSAQVAAHRLRTVLAQASARLEADGLRSDLASHRDAIRAFCAETGTDASDLAAALLALAVGESPSLGVEETGSPTPHPAPHDASEPARPGGPRVGGRAVGRARYRVAVGHTHGARPEAIVGAITGEGGLRGSELGKIDIYRDFSLVEIAGGLPPEAARRIGVARVAGRPLRIRLDEGPRRTTPDRARLATSPRSPARP